MSTPPRLLPILTRALGWNYVSGILLLLGQVAYTAVTARTIPPGAFGAYAVALTFIQVSGYLGGGTLGLALMRSPEVDRVKAGTALYMALGIGITLSAVIAIAAVPAAAVFHSPDVRVALLYLAWMPPLTGGSSVCLGLLRRNDRYRAAALIDATSTILGFGVGAVMALGGSRVVALTTAQLISAGSGLSAAAWFAREYMSRKRSAAAARELLPFAVTVSGQNLVHYLVEGMPTWFVSSVAGPVATGYFTRALQLVALPAYQLTTGIMKSLYPMYYRLTADARRLRSALTDAIVVAGGVSCGFFGVGAACGPPAALLLLGPKWGPSIQLFPLLCAAFAAQTAYAITASAAEALSWMRLIWRVQALFAFSSLVGLVVVGATHLRLVVVVILVTTLVSHLGMLLTPPMRDRVNLRLIGKAHLIHACAGVWLYAVAIAAENASSVTGPVRSLAVRALATAVSATSLYLLRNHLPGYATLVRRRRGSMVESGRVAATDPSRISEMPL